MTPDVLKIFFPTATIDRRSANNLRLTDLPAGEILGSYKGLEDDRVFYLVSNKGVLALLRIATAMKDSGYEAFGVIHRVEKIGSEEALTLFEQMHDGYYKKFPTTTSLYALLHGESASLEP